jgi:hypothetical protein
MLLYIAIFAGIFAVLVLLKFCEGSPVRTWKSVILVGIVLGMALGWYFHHALPAKAAPLPQSAKADAYRQELERTFRRVDGVDSASFAGNKIEMNFSQDKPNSELKRIAVQTAGSATWFLKTNNGPVQVTIHITVQGRDRLQMTLDSAKGVTDEQEF